MNILHAEDQSMLREAMKQLLMLTGKFKSVISVRNGREAIENLNKDIDVAILDIEMPYIDGLDVLNYIREHNISCKVIIVTTFKRPGYFEKALNLNVDAYVLKERSVDDLILTIDKVMNGQKEYSQELLPMMLTKNPLNEKEQAILQLIGEGLSSKEISEQLYLSHGTVRNYTSIITEKLGAENKINAWRIASDFGFIKSLSN
ncbi:response regulator transcription factor [Macrococcoides caseolyticum]|nr:response regulator transcription factor [Macrococcus caseolyticus]MBQ5152482.1 DNA-binding response regulator [Macrococcus caseolyticus]MDJ1156609.1 response regulator transcription factor [Macrococcus caseolyticus]PKD97887.1 DNA-binding response regulator [Macrococcus caseolyticus]PKE19020.1 DNA-binding response regulator [Macrococcus caseolyticus]PKE31333.1 DNA-binding response regulator [Macrococcus caseolyticus]